MIFYWIFPLELSVDPSIELSIDLSADLSVAAVHPTVFVKLYSLSYKISPNSPKI